MISGAILTANDASDALKTINFRAVKILILRTHSPGDGLILFRKFLRIAARFDQSGLAADVLRGPVVFVENLARTVR